MKLKKLTKINKWLLFVLILALGLVLFLSKNQKENKTKPEEKEEVSLEVMLNELSKIENLESSINKLDEKKGYFLSFYFRIENKFFVVLDDYYQYNDQREKLRRKVDYLLIKKEFLEEKININN